MKFLFSVLVFITCNVAAQNISYGEVTYVIKYDVKELQNKLGELPKNKTSFAMMEKVINESTDINGKLTFNGIESLYEVEKSLQVKEKGKMNLTLVGAGGEKKYYYNNLVKEILIEDCELLGDCFQIVNNPLNWNITQKNVIIGGKNCFVAESIELIEGREIKVTAWFTPDIPVNFGPMNYNGLPGLIMKVIVGKFTFEAKNIKISKEKNKKIKRNLKGKKITKFEFNEMCKKSFPKELFNN